MTSVARAQPRRPPVPVSSTSSSTVRSSSSSSVGAPAAAGALPRPPPPPPPPTPPPPPSASLLSSLLSLDASRTPSYFDDDEGDSMLKCGICFHEYDVASPTNHHHNSSSTGPPPDRRPCLSRTCCHSLCFACAKNMVGTAQGRDGHCPFCREPHAFPTPTTRSRTSGNNNNNTTKVVNHLTMRLLLLHATHRNEKKLAEARAEAAKFVVTKKDASTQVGGRDLPPPPPPPPPGENGPAAPPEVEADATYDPPARRRAISSSASRSGPPGALQRGRPKDPPPSRSQRDNNNSTATGGGDRATLASAPTSSTETGATTPAFIVPSSSPSTQVPVVAVATPAAPLLSPVASSTPALSSALAFNARPVRFCVGVASDKKEGGKARLRLDVLRSLGLRYASPVRATGRDRRTGRRHSHSMSRVRLQERVASQSSQVVPTIVKDPNHPNNVPDNSNQLFQLVAERKWVDAHLRAERHPVEATKRFVSRGRIITLVHAAVFFGAPYPLVGLLAEMDPAALHVRSWFMDADEKLLPVDWAVQLFRLDLIPLLQPPELSLAQAMSTIALSEPVPLAAPISETTNRTPSNVSETIAACQHLETDMPLSNTKSDEFASSKRVPITERTDGPVAAAEATESKTPARAVAEGATASSTEPSTLGASDESTEAEVPASGLSNSALQNAKPVPSSTAGVTESTASADESEAKGAAVPSQVILPPCSGNGDGSVVDDVQCLVAQGISSNDDSAPQAE